MQELQALQETHAREFAEQRAQVTQFENRCRQLESELEQSQQTNDELRQRARDVGTTSTHGSITWLMRWQTETALKKAQNSKDSIQSELDDLLIVFGDLEEKAAKYKVRRFSMLNERQELMFCEQARLKKLGEDVSDDDESDEEDSEHGEDGVD